jgi:Protein of unknown function (DUF742)
VTPAEWVDQPAGPVVRPYAMVRGRARSEGYGLDLVAFVVAVVEDLRNWWEFQPEHQQIVRMCRVPHTVSEVAGRMDLPVGVVRVLLGDLLRANAVRLSPPAHASGRPSLRLIQLVLEGLRAL